MHPILVQTISYAVVLLLALLIVSFLQRGFFWKYFRVRLSFGKLIMVKVRAINRDFYRVGRITEGFLIYKGDKNNKRLVIKDKSCFYRSLAVTWVDVDDETNAISKVDYTTVSGFDAVKYNDLFLRALYKPNIADTKEKLIIGAIVIIGLMVIGCLYFQYVTNKDVSHIISIVEGLKVGSVRPGTL